MKFTANIDLNGKTATGIEVPPEVVNALGPTKKPAVAVTINGYTYRSTIATMGGRFLIPVSGDVRKNAGVAAGDRVEVGLELDTAPREVVVPDDLQHALDTEPTAKAFFEGLSYSNKRRVVMLIDEAKTAETRQRRIEKSVSKLCEGKL
ncbi:MAG: YdeI/OmpD-associated family protein [Nitrolancea sp.]